MEFPKKLETAGVVVNQFGEKTDITNPVNGLGSIGGDADLLSEAIRRWNEYEKLKRDILLLLEATKIVADSSELAWPERSCVLTEIDRIAAEAAKDTE